ncbi:MULTISPECIES: hypothetical protein [Cysteiniphilum]|uniref:hypothetical protein n=1 Tax=Cysteiniphilum TaxID=2056696 RepID=UPI00177CDEB0|nr:MULTISPECIES: hypothetical protein [Cysteiniphilum]
MKKILTTIVILASVNCAFANTHDAIAQALKAKNVHIEYTKVTGKCDNGIERQLSLPVNDNYNCRLNHPNLAWFYLQLQY